MRFNEMDNRTLLEIFRDCADYCIFSAREIVKCKCASHSCFLHNVQLFL